MLRKLIKILPIKDTGKLNIRIWTRMSTEKRVVFEV